ncbi:hypothetical protein TB2_013135 [Malus domestica]
MLSRNRTKHGGPLIHSLQTRHTFFSIFFQTQFKFRNPESNRYNPKKIHHKKINSTPCNSPTSSRRSKFFNCQLSMFFAL